MTAPALVEHFFRHEYGRLVAMLSRRVGVEHVADIEDAVQSALMSALEKWTVTGVPENPSAWLFRVAANNVAGDLRKQARRSKILRQNLKDIVDTEFANDGLASETVQDDLLRMLFVCCDDAIPQESQIVLALKTLCGFDVREIAIRLFATEASVYKRLRRARSKLRDVGPLTNEPTPAQLSTRLPAVHKVLYLLFTEGHLSSHADMALRQELCEEALRLAHVLEQHPIGGVPETRSLVALMLFHLARMDARQNETGDLVLLEEQDRELWDQDRIREGLQWLVDSAEGDVFSRYHAEACIAAEHCLAPSFSQTRWSKITECYETLEQSTRSPIHRLNRSLAVAEWKGPAAGLAVLSDFQPPAWLAGSYQWAAVLSDLHRRCGNHDEAAHFRDVALNLAPTPKVKSLLQRRLRTG